MNTLRLLFWLRWRIGMNTTSARSRWMATGITALLALAMAPLYVGGAVGAWAFTSHVGAGALLVVFGIVQLVILWVSLLTGAMGRLFELDKLKRYPLRTFDVFAINTLASITEPIVLMTIPALVAGAVGVGQHDGALAGFAAMGGGVVLLLVTASILQLALALLDDVLRREWMRYVAAFAFTATIIGFQLAVGRGSARFASELRKSGLTPERVAAEAMRAFEGVPTVAAPASLAGAHHAGLYAEPLVGFVVCAALILLPALLGARVMGRAALRAAVGGTVRARRVNRAAGFASHVPGFTYAQSLLLAREWRYLVRTPAMLYQMAIIPLTVIALSFLRRPNEAAFMWFLPMFIMVSTLAGRNLMLWGYDGPGVRTLFLLPLRARDLVLTKNVVWLASALAESGLVFAFMTWRQPTLVLHYLPIFATGFVSVTLAAAVLGSWVSITRPVKPPQQGMARRNPGGVTGLLAFVAVMLTAGLLVLAVFAVRALTPDAYDDAASLVVTSLALVVTAIVWWISLDRNAVVLEERRETLIDVLAKSTDA